MKTDFLTRLFGDASSRSKYFVPALIGSVAIVAVAGAFLLTNRHLPVNAQNPVSQIAPTAATDPAKPAAAKPQYHKKEVVFKRTVAQADQASIRTSAQYDGYKALSTIPPALVARQESVRMPQFLNSTALANYQALSTLGTQQYYSNQNVQQLFTSMKNQQYLMDQNNRLATNNLNNQQYLNQYNSYLNNQTYLNNLNTYNNQQYLNNFNNNLNFQNYLNNYNNNLNSYTNPSFTQPNFSSPSFNQPSYTPPSLPQPNFSQPSFNQPNFSPPTFYQPPTFIQPPAFHFP
jgi:hypothetical protein